MNKPAIKDLTSAVLQHLKERCDVMHDAIQDGRTHIESIGTLVKVNGDVLEMFNCPHCKTTISRRPKDLRATQIEKLRKILSIDQAVGSLNCLALAERLYTRGVRAIGD